MRRFAKPAAAPASRELRLTIAGIAAGGDGVARHEGLVVFVPRAAPGDVVDAVVQLEPNQRFARGEITRIVSPGPDRVTPRCHHYEQDQCGGCQLQHVAYAAQLEEKRRVVHDAFERIGHRQATIDPVQQSPLEWEYRAKLTLATRRIGRHRIIGLRRRENPDAIFDLVECPITHPRIVAGWMEIRRAADLLPDARTLSGALRLDNGVLAFVLNGGEKWSQASAFADACPSLAVVRWHQHGGGVRVVRDVGRESDLLAPTASFQQVNPSVSTLLHDAVVSAALAHAPLSVIDAYAGAGATAVRLAAAGVRVTAIELDPEAAAHAAERLAPPSTSIAARVEDALGSALPADVVVMNPPRSGIDPRVASILEAQMPRPRAVIYVSCNPATLARDVARLPNFRVVRVTPFDMFPQTAHVESLCELVPEAA